MDTVQELQDARRVWHFWIDDQLIDTYGQQIGPYGIAIYAYLARRAKLGSAFPSHSRIAKDLHCSRDTVIRTLKKLQTVALISIEPRYTESGDPDTNLYTILDLSHLHTRGSSSQQQGSSSQQQGSSSQQQGSSSQQQGSSCEQGRVVAVSGGGSSCEQHEVFSFKDTQEKGEENPPTPVKGDTPTGENRAAAAKGKRQRQRATKHADTSPGAITVRDYLNTTNSRRYTTATQIETLLRTGVTVDDCRLVIEFGYAVLRTERPEWYEQYFDNVTPFRPQNFDKYHARAIQWDRHGRHAAPGMGRLTDAERRTAEATRRILEEGDTHGSAGQEGVLPGPERDGRLFLRPSQ